jgi:hypothetical protein
MFQGPNCMKNKNIQSDKLCDGRDISKKLIVLFSKKKMFFAHLVGFKTYYERSRTRILSYPVERALGVIFM